MEQGSPASAELAFDAASLPSTCGHSSAAVRVQENPCAFAASSRTDSKYGDRCTKLSTNTAPKPDVVPESERNPEPTQPIDVMKMPVKDLRAALQQRGLETKGLKKVLQKRLLDALGVPEGASLEFKN